MTDKTVTKGQVVVLVFTATVVTSGALGTRTQRMVGRSAFETNASTGWQLFLFITTTLSSSIQGTIGDGVSFFSTLIADQMTRMELLTFLVFPISGQLCILGATIVFGQFCFLLLLLLLLLALAVEIFATDGALLFGG